ncbi:hypothetical protein MOV66_25870 [Agrobacterium sp. SHOUNA12C]|uniref:Uncharacterized protein n=2 Tax=Rhizobium rhizogenes TaxID=359 RepID=B9JGX4_RHIR8|nr:MULTISPECIES: hypothetical protein [Rhizobium]ACM24970.1 conserved hypothetical protein [Rhizobium rhizogenes K84]KAA6475564.1 hypothetical protein DXT98_30350 [Agrobacterium sp. ICMP 7243]MCJ9724556.1 hypothetical protein [Agrobacterium sp. BETTINA12B]MCJ9760098.1 hypothetical protein [Agrobacterium sp. SHOUNA12C]OCJ03495.1 hypothetical protein A6U85_28895 [Agrobacterium sp. 13-626]OCJ23297.1 hypothetical protein A6U88_28355 [Agrobacterium sp. B131/95]OCJ27858.1 hypothetical protein A6U8
MDTTSSKSIVEVSVDSAAGRKALGIMNMRQALDLPDLPSFTYTHPDPRKAAAGVVVSREELARFLTCH